MEWKYWERIKDRYDVAFIGAATTILIGIAFIFFTIVVSDWMFPKSDGRNSATLTVATEEPVEGTQDANCTESKEVEVESNSTLEGSGEHAEGDGSESGNHDNGG